MAETKTTDDPKAATKPADKAPAPAAPAGSTNESIAQAVNPNDYVEPHPSSLDELTDEQIDNMDAATLRAVASDRGYDIRPGAAAFSRSKFKQLQAEDKGLRTEKDRKAERKDAERDRKAEAKEQEKAREKLLGVDK